MVDSEANNNDTLDTEEAAPEQPGESEQLKQAQAALEAAELKAQENWDKLLRREADHQNAMRRAQQDLEAARKFAIERFAGDMLAVVDSLERGVLAVPKDLPEEYKALKEGLDLTLKQLLAVFEKAGVTVFDPEGKPFDPQYHAALTTQETDKLPPNHVAAVIQKGYMLQGRLLRAANVIVSKAPLEKESGSPI